VALALGGVGWTALACLPVFEWFEANNLRPGCITTTGFATLPAALWGLGMPARDIAGHLAEHLPNRCFWQTDLLTLLSMIGWPLPNSGLAHAFWRSADFKRACKRLFGERRVEALTVPLHVTLIDCLTGAFRSISAGEIAALAYASAALLPALPPLCIDGNWLGDASVYCAAPVTDLLLRPNLQHAIVVTCSIPAPEKYNNLLETQFTVQRALQSASTKTGMLLAHHFMDGEVAIIAPRLQLYVDPFDVAIVPEVIAASERALSRAREQFEFVLQDPVA
jgi:predicted acylesterase/phospholipase RssA